MDNFVIEVLNKEHGKKVKKYFEDNYPSRLTQAFSFSNARENGFNFRFYGLINGTFNCFNRFQVSEFKLKIMTLEELEKKEQKFPREMLVSHTNDFKTSQKRLVLCKLEYNNTCVYIAVYSGFEDNFKKGEWFETTSWKYAKELPEESIKTPLQLEFEELQQQIKELQAKANEIQKKL